MLNPKGITTAITAFQGEPPHNSKVAREARKKRFIEIVLANPGITTQDAAEQAGMPKSSACDLRKEIAREHGQHYATPVQKAPKYTVKRQAKRILSSMAVSLESYASTGISGIDPDDVDITDSVTLDNLMSILDSLRDLTKFAKSLERRTQAPTENNVIQGNFDNKGTK